MANHHELANFIWQIADLLRGPYRPPQYERVMLPMTVLRRFDCVLAATKEKVLREQEKRKGGRFPQYPLVQTFETTNESGSNSGGRGFDRSVYVLHQAPVRLTSCLNLALRASFAR